MVELNIFVFSHPNTGAPRPFNLSVSTEDDGGTVDVTFIKLTQVLSSFSIGFPTNHILVSAQLIQFDMGDTNQSHIIIIKEDLICETSLNDFFLSNITLVSGTPPIEVIYPQATVFIDDSLEPECGELRYMLRLCIMVGYLIFYSASQIQFKLDMILLCTLQVRVREWWSSISLSSVILILELHDHLISLSALKMMEVYICLTICAIMVPECSSLELPANHILVSDQIIQFNVGDTNQSHIIIIKDDVLCEIHLNEFFLSNITLVSGIPPIEVIYPQATVFIDDSLEPECGKLLGPCNKEHFKPKTRLSRSN